MSDVDLSCMLSITRGFVQERYYDAHMVFQDDGHGQPLYAAVAIGKPFYDDYTQPSRKQHSIQLLTEW
jgi:hypothetical protein